MQTTAIVCGHALGHTDSHTTLGILYSNSVTDLAAVLAMTWDDIEEYRQKKEKNKERQKRQC